MEGALQKKGAVRAPGELPRLLYVGEVDVQAFCHGSLLLYRILGSYPKDKLRIVETSPQGSDVGRRLPGVAYEHFPLPARALFYNRYARLYAGLLPALSRRLSRDLCDRLQRSPWDVLLTVAHGHSWIPGFDLAKQLNRPAHLVVHDDWPRYSARSGLMQRRLDKVFSARYQNAASRLCVSPHMESEYRRRYQTAGKVLYPSRLEGADTARSPSPKTRGVLVRPTVAFAGTVASPGQGALLQGCAEALQPLGGRLLVYGPMTPEVMEQQGMTAPNIEVRGLVPSSDMVRELQTAADILYLPMSFDPQDQHMIQINFPSKLTDYTATGLPTLICAPLHSSATQWERDFPGAAAVVTSPDVEALRAELSRLCQNAARRVELAAHAIAAGNRCFTPERAMQVFHEALLAS